MAGYALSVPAYVTVVTNVGLEENRLISRADV